MAQLTDTLQSIAADFVSSLVSIIRTTPLASLSGQAARDGARVVVTPNAVVRPTVRLAKTVAARPAATAPTVKAASKPAAPKGRAPRRSSASVNELSARVAEAVKSEQAGIGISGIAAKLGVPGAELQRPLQLAVKAGLVRKTGEKRLTRYFPIAAPNAAKPAAAKTAKAPAAKAAPAKPVTPPAAAPTPAKRGAQKH